MLTQAGREGPNGENLGSILQSLQAFLMVRAEITYSVIGNSTREGGGEKYPSTPLLQLFCYFSISG